MIFGVVFKKHTFFNSLLGVFTFLVANYHTHLYGPSDVEDESHFLVGDKVPERLRHLQNGGSAAATSDIDEVKPTTEMTATVSDQYNALVSFGFSLLHLAKAKRERTTRGSGRYMVRAWVEPFGRRSLNDIESVTYRVWSDLKEPVFVTRKVESNFDLWVSVYGEFPLLARVKLKAGEEFTLQRYLDLPGRPTD